MTGGAGFIGSNVSKKLLKRGNQIVCVDDFNDYYNPKLKEDRIKIFLKDYKFPVYRVDIRNYTSLKEIFEKENIDKICHLAARAGVRASIEDPFIYQETNIKGTLNLLELAKEYKIKDFIYASSSSVYGGNTKIPFAEKDSVDAPISLYAASKKADELMAHVYHNLYNLNCTGLRFFTVYGPWGRPDMAPIKFAKLISNDKPIDVYNYGKHERDFTYIDDIVQGTVAALDHPFPYEVINLGNSNTVKLEYFISLLEKELGKKAQKNMLSKQPGDMEITNADITKAKSLLEFEPKTNIEEGIKKFINWFKEYYGK